LLRACSETVERDRKACNAYFRHSELPFISDIYLIAGNVSDMGHSLQESGQQQVEPRPFCPRKRRSAIKMRSVAKGHFQTLLGAHFA